jgi:hypothetical protein
MTSLNRTTSRTHLRVSVITSLALASVLALTGCAPDEATPTASTTPSSTETATPTPTVAAAPASADRAVADATATLQEYTAMVNQILLEGGANPERIDAYAISVVRDEFVSSAQQIAAEGYQIEGGLEARVESGIASEAQVGGETLEFGSVQLTFCNDSRNRTMVLADGSVPQLPADRAPRLDAGLMFDPVKGSWFVRSLTRLGTSCA